MIHNKSAITIFTIILMLISVSHPAVAQSIRTPIKVELETSSDKVFINESFVLSIRIEYTTHFSDIKVMTPQFPELMEFEKISGVQSSESHNVVYNSVTDQYDVRAAFQFARQYKALQIGKYQIPPIEITIIDPQHADGQLKVRTNPLLIEVVDIAGMRQPSEPTEEPDDIRDIKSPVSPPMWILYACGVGGFMVLLALSILVTKLVQSPGRNESKKTIRRIVNPYQRAKEKLTSLKIPDFQDDEAVALFYVRLSDIVKEYLASKHGVIGFEATSYEITSTMRDVYHQFKRGNELISSLEMFLKEIDLGKYAKAYRDAIFMETAIERAKVFVDLDDTITLESKENDEKAAIS